MSWNAEGIVKHAKKMAGELEAIVRPKLTNNAAPVHVPDSDAEIKKKQLNEELTRLQNENESAIRTISVLSAQLSQTQSDLIDMQAKKENAEGDLGALHSQLSEVRDNLTVQKTKADAEIETLNIQLQKLREELERIRNEKETAQATILTLNHQLVKAKSEKKKVQVAQLTLSGKSSKMLTAVFHPLQSQIVHTVWYEITVGEEHNCEICVETIRAQDKSYEDKKSRNRSSKEAQKTSHKPSLFNRLFRRNAKILGKDDEENKNDEGKTEYHPDTFLLRGRIKKARICGSYHAQISLFAEMSEA